MKKLSTVRCWGLLFVGLIFIVAYTWGIWAVFTSKFNGGNDFFSRYVAWRAFLLEGRNPYSDEVTHEIQIAMNGREALFGEDENAVIYPWYAVLLQWPFVFFPWPVARALYMVLCQLFIVIGLILTARFFQWNPPPALLAGTALWAVLFYPEGRGIIIGQIVITQYFLGVLALWLLHRRQDGWAAVCLAFTTVRPPAVFLFVPFVLFYMLFRKRWRFLILFAVCMLVLFFSGFIFLPTWASDWLHRMSRYTIYTMNWTPIWQLTHLATHWGTPVQILLNILCAGVMVGVWWIAARRPDDAAFYYALSVTFVVSELISPRSATPNYIFYLFPTIMIFAALSRTWPKASSWLIGLIEVVGLVGLWWLFAITVVGNAEQPIMYVPQPVLLAVVLPLTYRWLVTDHQRIGVAF